MRTHFQRDLDQMQQHILELAALVEAAVNQTIHAGKPASRAWPR